MCETCGCDAGTGAGGTARLTTLPAPDHEHGHGHDHGHGHTVTLDQKVLAHNDDLAGRNRAWLGERGIVALNVMSSPGSSLVRLGSGPEKITESDIVFANVHTDSTLILAGRAGT